MDISERKNGYEWVNLDMVDAERAKEEIVTDSTTTQVKNKSKYRPINFLTILCVFCNYPMVISFLYFYVFQMCANRL